MRFSGPEQLVFIILLAACVWGFWRRFGRVVHKIQKLSRMRIFNSIPSGRAFGISYGEVLLQGKVIRPRPLPGVAHAFVFWGFCAFALATLNHFATAFEVSRSCRASIFALAAVFAVLVAMSIAGLAVRRFVIRPHWLGPLSFESGVIALLIFVLMGSYLATFLVADTAPAAKIVWWPPHCWSFRR